MDGAAAAVGQGEGEIIAQVLQHQPIHHTRCIAQWKVKQQRMEMIAAAGDVGDDVDDEMIAILAWMMQT